MSENKRKINYILDAWLVIVLALCFGLGLAGVHVGLSKTIMENRTKETLSQIPALVPGSKTGELADISGKRVYRALDNGKQVGWVIPSGGQGFADRIELLIGVDLKVETVTGLYVLDQKETPGLGNKIVEKEWRDLFTGKKTRKPLKVTKAQKSGDQEISSVTGATISSESVCGIVNRTIQELKDHLIAEIKKG